jgi:hypothetical protein
MGGLKYARDWTPSSGPSFHAYAARRDERRYFTVFGLKGELAVDELSGGWMVTVTCRR